MTYNTVLKRLDENSKRLDTAAKTLMKTDLTRRSETNPEILALEKSIMMLLAVHEALLHEAEQLKPRSKQWPMNIMPVQAQGPQSYNSTEGSEVVLTQNYNSDEAEELGG